MTPAPGETFFSVVAGGGGAGLRSESRERRARELSEARRKRDRAEMEARTPYNVSMKIFTLQYFFHIYQLEQHPGGGQQVAGPPAPPLICQWQHSDQLSF